MSVFLAIEMIAHLVTVGAGVILVYQFRVHLQQQRLDSFLTNFATNRELVKLGMETGDMLKVLEGKRSRDKLLEKRYMQLWLNHIQLIYITHKQAGIARDFWETTKADIADFAQLPAMKAHWKKAKQWYPHDFQVFMDGLIEQSA